MDAAADAEVGERSLFVRNCLAGDDEEVETEEDSTAGVVAADVRRLARFFGGEGAGCTLCTPNMLLLPIAALAALASSTVL